VIDLPELGSSLPEIALRTLIVYVFLVLILRVAGKREVGQLSILDLVVLLLVADAVQNSMVGDNTTLAGGVVAVAVLVSADLLLHRITTRSRRVRRLIEGEPRILVRHGRVMWKALEEEGVDAQELKQALRAHGVARPEDADLVVLETNGSMSVIPRRLDAPGSGPAAKA
jgi:uncharacterized membrane protein YcaP (DUF421 family)